MTSSPITLHILNTEIKGSTWYSKVFDQDVIKIGRLANSHMYLDDEAVARMHAVIERSDDKLELVDLGSATGTHLNDKPVKNAAISHGDVITIGPIRILVQMGDKPVDLSIPKGAAQRFPEIPELNGEDDDGVVVHPGGIPNPYDPKPGDVWVFLSKVRCVVYACEDGIIKCWVGDQTIHRPREVFAGWLHANQPQERWRILFTLQ